MADIYCNFSDCKKLITEDIMDYSPRKRQVYHIPDCSISAHLREIKDNPENISEKYEIITKEKAITLLKEGKLEQKILTTF